MGGDRSVGVHLRSELREDVIPGTAYVLVQDAEERREVLPERLLVPVRATHPLLATGIAVDVAIVSSAVDLVGLSGVVAWCGD